MTIFEAVKSTVTPRMAAEHYGLSVSHNGMVCCPFHDDRHPSMKLYDDHFHCFGCQATGDVIEFTSKLFGITALEAAQKLAADFGIRGGASLCTSQTEDVSDTGGKRKTLLPGAAGISAYPAKLEKEIRTADTPGKAARALCGSLPHARMYAVYGGSAIHQFVEGTNETGSRHDERQ